MSEEDLLPEKNPRWQGLWGPLALVAGVHLVLALFTLIPAVHTGGDNAAYLTLASSLAEQGRYAELWHPGSPAHTKYPPGFPAVLAVWMIFGFKSFASFKAIPLVFTTAATGLCYLWLRRIHRVSFAAGIALLFGASNAVLFASHWILSDPMFLALTMGALWLITPRVRPGTDPEEWEDKLVSSRRVWAGVGLVILAYFTRSAGLPLVLAVGVWLARRRRFKPLAIYGVLFAVPAFLWWLRDARTGHDYISEFWMVNPYAPVLGEIGVGGLLVRMGGNLWQYTTEYIPQGITGFGGGLAVAVGLPLALLALYGWVRRMRAGPGVAEWFALLYSGLILIWPAVWSGDRFALPLFPLALLYAGEAIAILVDTFWTGRERLVLGVVAAGLAALMGVSWFGDLSPAHACRERVRAEGPWGCYGQNVRDFAAIAHWSGDHLDPDELVASRKPRLFYLLSGRQSVTYPFASDGTSLLRQADSLGVGYVVRGTWDRATPAYVDPALVVHPERFCRAATLATGPGQPTHLIRILDEGSPRPGTVDGEEAQTLQDCLAPDGLVLPDTTRRRSGVIPILDR